MYIVYTYFRKEAVIFIWIWLIFILIISKKYGKIEMKAVHFYKIQHSTNRNERSIIMKGKKLLYTLTAAAMLAAMPMGVFAADSLLHSADFEGGTGGWSSFGGTSVSTTNNAAHGGSYSLWVGDRTANWNGASCSMSSIMTAGESYTFTSYVMSNASSDTIQLQLKYTDASGEAVYKTLGQADASNSGWSEISGTYEVPSDASDILMYFQTAEGTNGFYVDDITITGKASWSTAALEEEPLKNVYANYFRIGCAATPSELTSPISQEVVAHHFNCLTVGNELKPDYVLDKTATQAIGDNVSVAVSLDAARSVLTFCQENNISVRGHVLLWHSQTPDWFFKENFSDSGNWVSKEVMSQRLENYIEAVMYAMETEFPDLDVYAWDVVNECYMDDGSLRAAGTDPSQEQSRWTMIYGDDTYIDEAFTYARKYAPEDCKLFYNDYNEYIEGKREAIYTKMSALAEKGLIDGIGMQSHLDVGYPNAALYRQAIDRFNSTGLEVQITELDITQYNNNGDLTQQTAAYESIMGQIVDAKRDGANITAVIFWGITDATSWRSSGSPLLFDESYAPKDSYYAVANQIDESEWGSTEQSTEDTADTSEDVLPSVMYGDVNADGIVNIADVLTLNKNLLAGEALSAEGIANADVDLDGNPTSSDALNILKYTVKLIDSLPVTE